jgi:hypothetical protein
MALVIHRSSPFVVTPMSALLIGSQYGNSPRRLYDFDVGYYAKPLDCSHSLMLDYIGAAVASCAASAL